MIPQQSDESPVSRTVRFRGGFEPMDYGLFVRVGLYFLEVNSSSLERCLRPRNYLEHHRNLQPSKFSKTLSSVDLPLPSNSRDYVSLFLPPVTPNPKELVVQFFPRHSATVVLDLDCRF